MPELSLPSNALHFFVILATATVLSACGASRDVVERNDRAVEGFTIRTHPWHNTDHHRADGRFENPWDIEEAEGGFFRRATWLAGRIFAGPSGEPAPYLSLPADSLLGHRQNLKAHWIGHATTLVQHGHTFILTDPIFTRRASPVNFAGPARHQPPAVQLEDLPGADVVVISHSHFDHLDKASVIRLHERFEPLFLVPLGTERTLLRWGVTRVLGLDWWQYVDIGGLRVHCTPARHWTTRGLFSRNKTLWASWFFEWPEEDLRVYFGGDTAYGPFFRQIGDRLGSPQLAIMPIGAYRPRWFMASSHVSPPEAVQAFLDLGAEEFFGMHWGTFNLADEPLDEPPQLTRQAAREQGLSLDRIHLPPVGGMVRIAE